jgi:hypothetical protein
MSDNDQNDQNDQNDLGAVEPRETAPRPEVTPPTQLPAERMPTPVEWGIQRIGELGETLDQARRNVDSLFPPEFRAHARVAQREVWLALRALIDARLEAIDRAGQPQPPAPKPPSSGRIDIE